MKRVVCFLLMLTMVISSLLSVTVNAAVGDVVGQAVHTDIVAYINHYAIPSYAANGKSCIVAEDLRNFGFDVIWDGDARTLSIYRNTNLWVSEMQVDKSEQTGKFFSNIFETDIKVYANGIPLTSYTLNGYTMVPIEELTMFGEVYWVPEERAVKLWVDGLSMRETKQQPTILPKVVFSANIGEVDGVIYSTRNIYEGYYNSTTPEKNGKNVRNINTCKLLLVNVPEGKQIGGFCYYNGYIYYSLSTEGSDGWRAWMYRCKPDGSENQLIWADGDRDFIIANGFLYTRMAMSEFANIAINLTTLDVSYADYPDYRIPGSTETVVYNDMVFHEIDGNIYRDINGQLVLLATDASLNGGFTSKYLYFAEYKWDESPNAKLYRIPLNGGVKEYLDSVMPAGGGGPFFCW